MFRNKWIRNVWYRWIRLLNFSMRCKRFWVIIEILLDKNIEYCVDFSFI